MSDQNAEPGAPTAKAADEATDKVTSKSVSVPQNAVSVAKQLDHTLLRLNKLLASPGGLSSFLSTFNYVLYVLAYIQSKSPPLSDLARKLLHLLNYKKGIAKSATTTLKSAEAAVPPAAALAGLISRARTTLRLFGLFPLYAWLRTLLAGRKSDADPVLHRIAFTQCLLYITYQALENVSVLADNGAVSSKFIALINKGDSTTARLYSWAYRAWLGGVSCDFLRLAREAQLENRRRAVRKRLRSEGKAVAENQEEEDKKTDAKWWNEFMIASAWFPMAFQFGGPGIPFWNIGWMGVCGLVAGSTRTKGLWAATLQ